MRIGTLLSALIFGVAVLFGTQGHISSAEAAKVTAKIDISSQRMYVYQNGRRIYSWKVSTGRGRYRTPTGNYRPTVMRRMHYASKYNNAPMPHSIFFRGGYAIHGTNHIRRLGRPASHGCIRLHPANAKKFFDLVLTHKRSRTEVKLTRVAKKKRYYKKRKKYRKKRRSRRKRRS